MRVTVDLGFYSLLFGILVCVVFPVIGLVVRYKWRRSEERAEEIKRLLILAAEESARAEREAAASYHYDDVNSNSNSYQYVAAKSYRNSAVSASYPDVAANSYRNGDVLVAKSSQCVVCFSPTTNRCARCKAVYYCSGKCQIAHWRQGHKDDCHPPSETRQTDDLVRDINKKVAEPDYRGINDEKSRIESTEVAKPYEKPPLLDIKHSPRTSCEGNDKARVDSLVEENIIDSNSELSCNSFSGFSASTGANESSDDSSVCESIISNDHERSEGHICTDRAFDISGNSSNGNCIGATIPLSPKFAHLVESARPAFGKEESKLASNDSSGLMVQKGGTTEPSKVSSGFWNCTLDLKGTKDDSFGDPLPSHSNVRKNMQNEGFASSENEDLDSSRRADASSIHNLHTVGSNVSNHVVINPRSSLRSTETKLVSRAEDEHLHYSSKSMNNVTHSNAANSSQTTNGSPNSKDGLKTSVVKVIDQFRGSDMTKHFPIDVGSDVAGKYSDKGLFPYDLFVKLYNWNRVDFQPFGLTNCGNSCFANAVLQCLVLTPPLTAYLLQGLHSKSCVNKKWCFTCEFESLILKSKDTKHPLSPIGILSQLQNIGSQLGNGREEDAHEFLRHVVETMQSICVMECGVDASDALKEQTNLVGLTFGGYLRSKIKCMKCGGKSERQERMMDLTVEIEGEIASLEEALRQFTSTETLDGENKYHCARCKSYEKAKKQMAVSEAPNVLTIALKRFRSGKYGKLNKPIRFPEILDLAPFMSGSSDLAIYRLYGVVVHLDTMNAAFSGHYVSYVKNFQNSWFKVDDSVVTPVELQTVLTKGAYILLYARCSPRAPRLIRDMIVSDSKVKVHGKTITTKHKHSSSHSDYAECMTNSVSPYDLPALETIYSKFHRMKSIMEEDSSSDSSSLLSNNSDECSCSTDSTSDSTGTDEFADYIFGNSGRGGGVTSSRGETDSHLYRRRPVSEGCVSHLHHNLSIEHRKLDTSRSSSSFRESDSFERAGSNHFSYVNSGVSYRKARERTD
ncbi:ubiquitin carboxyl-terminal hydrolase 16-like [Vicia villosa]|uniref:ubiquitin carboxyl-terminal hydrolase 16-like n=1 Tax=Vicia villosa TaxID=3911 RepID=UPI00273C8359|nr:ubiquitin carboxyl-terminal hydrolase 16-like [Vicia villosa]